MTRAPHHRFAAAIAVVVEPLEMARVQVLDYAELVEFPGWWAEWFDCGHATVRQYTHAHLEKTRWCRLCSEAPR